MKAFSFSQVICVVKDLVAARFVTTAHFVTKVTKPIKFEAQPARFVTTAHFVTKVTKRMKFDAQPARFVTPARFVITW